MCGYLDVAVAIPGICNILGSRIAASPPGPGAAQSELAAVRRYGTNLGELGSKTILFLMCIHFYRWKRETGNAEITREEDHVYYRSDLHTIITNGKDRRDSK